MRIAVMAAGAVGGYYGARMAAAEHDVTFIARGAHRDAIRRDGLRIESALGDLHLRDVKVTDDPKQVGPVDLVLFAVKLWDTETAAAQTRPLMAANTRVITLQNGVDSVERLVPILGADATIGGATYVVATIMAPRRDPPHRHGSQSSVWPPRPTRGCSTCLLCRANKGSGHRHHADG